MARQGSGSEAVAREAVTPWERGGERPRPRGRSAQRGFARGGTEGEEGARGPTPPGGNRGHDCGTTHTPAPGSAVQTGAHRGRPTCHEAGAPRPIRRARAGPRRELPSAAGLLRAPWDSPRWARIDRGSPTSSFPPRARVPPWEMLGGRVQKSTPAPRDGRAPGRLLGAAVTPLPFGVSSPPGCLLERRRGRKPPWCVRHRRTLCSLRPSGPLA